MNKLKKSGLPPGTILYTGHKTEMPIWLNYLEYSNEVFKSERWVNKKDMLIHSSQDDVNQWYDVRGLHDTDLIQKIATNFGIHPLISEDIADVHNRPKYEEFGNGHFIQIKAIQFDPANTELNTQSIAIYFGNGYTLSFQENDDDIFKSIRDRIEFKRGRIHTRNSDYLSYALLDIIIDQYYHVLHQINDRLETLEDNIIESIEKKQKMEIFLLKKVYANFKKILIPTKDAIQRLIKSESELIEEKTYPFLLDLNDHIEQLNENIDNQRNILFSIQDLYHSEMSMKMNEVMQFLTIVTATFVPISFLAGLYGMNFSNMPELGFKYGYYILLSVMFSLVVILIFYFKKKKWI